MDLATLDRGDRIAVLRSRMAALGGTEAPAVADPEEILPVPSELGKLLVSGGLARRQAVAVSDCPALVVEIICSVTARGGQVAVVGWPDLLLAQVSESGDVDKVIVIPDPGPDPWSVVGVLVEGMDLVIYRGGVQGSEKVTPTRAPCCRQCIQCL